jgi:hypothetical protein
MVASQAVQDALEACKGEAETRATSRLPNEATEGAKLVEALKEGWRAEARLFPGMISVGPISATEGVTERVGSSPWSLTARNQAERELTTAELISSAVSAASEGVAEVERLVSHLASQQVAREGLEAVEAAERAAREERDRYEQAAAEAEAVAAEAASATEEWGRAAKAAARVANHQGASTERDAAWAHVQLATAAATDEAGDAARVAREAAAAADESADAAARRAPWSDGYTLVISRGGQYTVERFRRDKEARHAASKLWVNWVLYKEEGPLYVEAASGGVGFSCGWIRRYVEANLQDAKQEARRVSRGPGREAVEVDAVSAHVEDVGDA